MINSLLTFGAKSVNPKILEQTLTVREEVVNEIEKNCINKTLNSSTWQSLIIATRGSGKTHIINVLYHRLKNNKKISNKSVIAYMSEDEVGIANFTDLMISILRAFIKYKEPGSESIEEQIIKASLVKDSNKREIFVKDILIEFAKKRIIILIIENFDKILNSLGLHGQGGLRDFIHQYNNLSIIATSQNLIANLQDSKNPFYNFFNVTQLKKLDLIETIRFLEKIAETEGNQALIDEMKKPSFEGKLRTIYELTEGNHRLLVTFYSFLKAEFKTELSRIFIKVMNGLKPYYEQFINVLPAQQQKIVKYLSLYRGAVSGKEIARACFIEPNVFSKQISLLFERGMIDKNKSGKDVFYELKEPLMRICFEISENTNGIAKLFVDFLSCFYDRQEIRNKYVMFKYGARFQNEGLKQKYENEAMMYNIALDEKERVKISFAHQLFDKANTFSELDNIIYSSDSKTLKQIDQAYEDFNEGNNFLSNNQFQEAVESYQRVVKINPENYRAYNGLGNMYLVQGNYDKAMISYKKAIEINPNNYWGYFKLGKILLSIDMFEEAKENFKKAIQINPGNNLVYIHLGIAYIKIKQYEDAINNFLKIIEKEPDSEDVYNSLGVTYLLADKIDDAFETFNTGLKINPENNHIKFSLLGAYIRVNDQNKSKELFNNLVSKVEDDLLQISLTEDIFYNLFKFGSDAFIKSYFDFLLKLIFKEKRDNHLWKALADSLFDVLINIEDYDKERLNNIEKALTELLAKNQESIIPLKMFSIGVAYLKNKEKNAIFKLSKEERKLFKQAVLDERELLRRNIQNV
ncbi:MAG: tetratricopeptide repeat protein [Bacteroidales bacterium]|nr:tetratricopeptide repeat protein [Bacteroidales bacterium]